MGLIIPTYDPIANTPINLEDEIYAAAKEVLALPVYIAAINSYVDGSSEYIQSMEEVLATWQRTGQDAMPLTLYDNSILWLNYRTFRTAYDLVCFYKNKRYAKVLELQQALVTQYLYTPTSVTQRDIYWKSWLNYDSNLTADIPAYFSQGFAELSATNKHADIAITGTDNNEAYVSSSGTHWRTILADTPIFRKSYWEIKVQGNIGAIAVGIATLDQDTSLQIGHDGTNSIGFKLSNEVITHTLPGNSTEVAITNIDATVGAGFTLHTICLIYDPDAGTLYASKDGVTWTSAAVTYNTYLQMGIHGDLYPAISLTTATNVAKCHFGNTNSLNTNYLYSSNAVNTDQNYADGVYIRTALAPETWGGTQEGLATPGWYSRVKLDALRRVVDQDNN